MPTITNRSGYFEGLVRAVEHDPYDAGDSDITASKLGDPPQLRVLERRHASEIVEDVEDRIWALLGQAVHAIIERANPEHGRTLAEVRLFSEFLGWKVSGALDSHDLASGILTDVKVTSAWSIVFGSRLKSWEAQLNVLAELLERNGYEVNGIQVCAILRDWQRSKASSSPDYPQTQVVTVRLELWPREERVRWIEERVRLHQAAEAGDIPPCTDEERWAKDTKYAVVKKGQKRAVKICDSEAEANALVSKGGAGYSVEARPGAFTRCEAYCPVGGTSGICPQWAKDRPETAEVSGAKNGNPQPSMLPSDVAG